MRTLRQMQRLIPRHRRSAALWRQIITKQSRPISTTTITKNNNNVISFTNTDELEIPHNESLSVGDQNYGIFHVVKKTGDNTLYLLSKGRAGHNGTNYRRYYTYMTDSLFGHEIDEDTFNSPDEIGSAWEIILHIVLLPLPFRPRKPTFSFFSMLKFILLKTCNLLALSMK